MILPIYTYGQPVLRKEAQDITPDYPELKALIANMYETLTESDGIGLAAPQIGILRRIVVILDDDGKMFELINPEITEAVGEQEAHEGCLSVPGVFGVTRRPARVTVRAKNVKGEDVTYTREGITAVCFCHELDHLDGILFRTHVEHYLDPDED